MRATSCSVFGWFCEVNLKLVVAGSRPSVVCLRGAKPPGLPWGCPVAEVGPSWAGGNTERPSGEIRDETPEPVGAESALMTSTLVCAFYLYKSS
jgi:hypothetical protein